MADWQSYLTEHKESFLNELLEFLRIPSISALPAHAGDVQGAAQWVETRMRAAGIESVRIMPTGGHPVVYGDWLHAPGKPTVLIYGHFDTQPVDPLELWDSPPFEPVIKEGRIVARGSTDDKGNMFVPIIVAEAMLKTGGRLPVNLKFLFEGEEEIASPSLPKFIVKNKDLLSCDVVLSADGGQWAEDQPAVCLGTRGVTSVFVDVQGPDHDVHSGTYGGAIANPIHALVQILNSLHDADGRVTVKGFYDDVRPLTKEERAQVAQIPFDEPAYLRETGSVSLFGEKGFTPMSGQGLGRLLKSTGSGEGFRERAQKPFSRARPMPRFPAAWWRIRIL
jgi:acetylornithine deacetylase/succinyl-diaminopimelate desuccinylase-like protein